MSEQTALKSPTEDTEKTAPAVNPANATHKRKAPAQRRARPELSRPAFRRSLRLNSLQAQKVVDRSFGRVSNSLFSIDVILQIIGDREDVGDVESIISSLFEKVSDDLLQHLAQMRSLMESNGIEETPDYTAPKEYPIEITSPQIAEFARLLSMLDELMSMIDTLWLNTVLKNRQRADATFQWQQRLIRLAGRIIGLEKRARIAAYNKGKKDEVDTAAPELDTEDAEIASASEEEITEEEKAEVKTEK